MCLPATLLFLNMTRIFKNVHAPKVFLNFPQQLAFREQHAASVLDSSSSGQLFHNSQTVCFWSNVGQMHSLSMMLQSSVHVLCLI